MSDTNVVQTETEHRHIVETTRTKEISWLSRSRVANECLH